MTLGFNKRYSAGLLFQAAYTLGDSHDTWSGGQIGGSDFDNGAGSATDWCDPEYEYGPSNFDVRHNFVVNAVYQLPWGQNLTGVRRCAREGLERRRRCCRSQRAAVDAAARLRPGRRSTERYGRAKAEPERDGELPGNGGAVVRPVRVLGSGRGRVRQCAPQLAARAGIKVADVSVFKNFTVGRYTTQFRIEAFNAFNLVNLGLPDAIIFTANGVRNPTAGQIRTTATPARQFQIGLKFLF